MIDVYRSDEEQIAVIKAWWRQHGTMLISVLLLTLMMSCGWRYWQYRQSHHLAKASVLYNQLMEKRTQSDVDDQKILRTVLLKKYSNTLYADFVALQMAQEAIVANHFDEGIKSLQWVVEHASEIEINQLARLNLARVFLAQKKPQDALRILSKGSFASSFWPAYLQSQAYLLLHQYQQASDAIQKASKALQSNTFGYAVMMVDATGTELISVLNNMLHEQMSAISEASKAAQHKQ